MQVVSYLKGIPGNNKNPEKPEVLRRFIEGVNAVGDQGVAHDGLYVPSDVAILQGYVHEDSPGTPHLVLRKQVLVEQAKRNARTIIVDSNLFLYLDKSNQKRFLRYSMDGVFPTTGNYFWDNPDPQRWEKIKRELGVVVKPWRTTGTNILICLQRNGGWSMKGKDNQEWAIDMIKRIRQHSDRPIVVRGHPGDRRAGKYLNPTEKTYKFHGLPNVHMSDFRNRTLQMDLASAYCTVVFNSSPAVASAIEGVPIFVDDPDDCQAKDVANTNISNIEAPDVFDRTHWLQKLSMCHWNFTELSDGTAWRHMRKYV
tara:strand:- start:1259 stop:2194 length:936 start_codon:yes stop_codon:yes gene_type:complete